MAVRRISTVLAVDGEREYKQAIATINSELTTLKSNLALTSSEFRNSANTTEALTAKNKALTAVQDELKEKIAKVKEALENAQRAQKQHGDDIKNYEQKIAAAEKQLEKLKNSTGDTTKEQEKLTAEIEDLKNGLADSTAKYEAATKGINNHQKSLNSTTIELNKLDDEIKENNKHLDEAKNSTDGVATSIDQYGKNVKEATGESKEFGETSKKSVDAMADALAAAGIVASFKQIADAIYACIGAAAEFESAITGVFKTVEGTDEQLQGITTGIKEMALSIPATTTEISAVAEAAGQLGIATDDVLDFTEVMINLGVSTNMTAEEAASMIAKFANITGLDPANYDRMGAAIVALGNNYATTENDIVRMSTRLASAGTIAGLTEPEILALSTAMSSVGIEAEAGGTAMAQTLAEIEKAVANGGDTLRDYADVAGMSAAEFANAWETSPIEALQAFIGGLGELEGKGESATLILDELGLSGIRQSNMLKALSLSADNLGNAVDLSNKSWKENNALTEEAQKRYQTTESKQVLLKNSVNALQVAVGDALLPAFNSLNEGLADAVQWITKIVEENPWLVKTLTALAIGIGSVTVGLVAYKGAVALATVVQNLLNAAMLANPATLVAMAIVALTAGIWLFVSSAESGAESLDSMTEASRNSIKAIEEADEKYKQTSETLDGTASLAETYIDRLVELEKQGVKTTAQEEEYKLIVEKLNTIMPELNAALDEQTGLLVNGAKALRDQTDAWMANARQQAIQEKYNEVIRAQTDAELELAETTSMYNRLSTENSLLTDQKSKAYEKLAEYLKITTKELDGYNYVQWSNIATSSHQDETLKDLLGDYSSLEDQIQNNNETLVTYSEAMETSQGVIDGNKEKIDELTESYSIMNGNVSEVNAAFQTQSNTIAGLQNDVDDLKLKYQESFDTAYLKISEEIGLFDELGDTSGTSIDTLINNLKKQEDYMNQYAENIKKAMELGVNEGLIRELDDGSVESAKILQGIVDDGGKNIDELNEALKGVAEGKQNFASSVAEMQTGFDDAMSDIEKRAADMAEELDESIVTYESGKDTVQAYVDGIKSQYGEMEKAFRDLAQKGSYAYNSSLSLNSANRAPYWDGSHADGLEFVPFDNYSALLHKGERVLTAEENSRYDQILASLPTNYDLPQSKDYSGILSSLLQAVLTKGGGTTTYNNYNGAGRATPSQTDAAINIIAREILYGR